MHFSFQEVRMNVREICKCHGLSGACYVRACWDSMRPIRLISGNLKKKYVSALQVKVKKNRIVRKRGRRGKRNPRADDLVYLKKVRGDFCRSNPKMGSYGTKGRRCNGTSDGIDSCDDLCCGRGYQSLNVTRTYSCKCQFNWCCKLVCEKCQALVTEDYCR